MQQQQWRSWMEFMGKDYMVAVLGISYQCQLIFHGNVLKISVTIYRDTNIAYARNHKITSFRIFSVRTLRLWLSFVTKMSISWGTVQSANNANKMRNLHHIKYNVLHSTHSLPLLRILLFLWDVKRKGVKKQNLQISQFYICWFSFLKVQSIIFQKYIAFYLKFVLHKLSILSKENKQRFWLLSDRHYQLLFIVWQRKFLGKD